MQKNNNKSIQTEFEKLYLLECHQLHLINGLIDFKVRDDYIDDQYKVNVIQVGRKKK